MALAAVALVLAVLCLVVYWPRPGSGVEGARLLDATELRELPAGPTGDQLIAHHLGCRIFGHGGCGSWKELPETARNVWAGLVFESRIANGLKLYFLVAANNDAPTLAETAAAYQALGDPAAAAAVQALGQLSASSPDNALAALEQRLAVAQARMSELRHAYVAEHAEEIAGRR